MANFCIAASLTFFAKYRLCDTVIDLKRPVGSKILTIFLTSPNEDALPGEPGEATFDPLLSVPELAGITRELVSP